MHHFPSSGLATRSGASRAHCTPNWCTHNPQLEQTRTTWCYIQPCTLQPCVITSDTSLDELLGAKIKKNLSRECSHVLTHPKVEFLVHVRHSTLAFIRPADQNNLAILECLSLSTHLYIFVSVVFLRDLQPKQV